MIVIAEDQPSRAFDIERAQRSADRLALALEEVGFDVGLAFPMLGNGRDRRGVPSVELGRITTTVADRLCMVLSLAAQQGVRVPIEDQGT